MTPEQVEAWKGSRDDALLFVEGVLGVNPEPWQREALTAVSVNGRVAIKSGHGVGKTAFIAWVTLWWLYTRQPCKILVTANSEGQLRDVTWAEILMWAQSLPEEMRLAFDWGLERISNVIRPESAFASRRTASIDRPEALQGFHSKHTLVIVEEASGIPDQLFDVMTGALSTEGSKMVMVGNPTRGSGYFFDAFGELADLFYRMTVSSEDVPRARSHIRDVEVRAGKDSNEYRVRVLGEFPTADTDTVIPLYLCQEAVKRDVEPTEVFRVVWGLDVARFGDDRSALAKRMGNVLLEPITVWKNRDVMGVSGSVVAEYERVEKQEPYFLPSEILVDSIGYGAGVVDRLCELGLPARGVNVGETASSHLYSRLRDELWFRAKEWFAEKNCRIPEDGQLISELTSPTYVYLSNGKLLVESKDDSKKRLRRSPDLADAFVLTFAGGLDTRQTDDWGRKWKRTTSWMAA